MSENPFNSAFQSLEGISVQYPQDHPILGHPKRLLKGFLWTFREFQNGNQARIIELIVVKGKIFGKTSMQVRPISQGFMSVIEHVWGRIDSGDLKFSARKHRQMKSDAAPDVKKRFSGRRLEQIKDKLCLKPQGGLIFRIRQPNFICSSVIKVKDVSHILNFKKISDFFQGEKNIPFLKRKF